MSGMARAHAGRARVRLARTATVTLAAGALAGLPALAGAARSAIQPAGPLALAVTSVNPSYATPRHTISITGTVRNQTGQPTSGLTVQLLSSRSAFTSMSALQQYAAGGYVPLATLSVPPVAVPPVPAYGSAHWTLRLPVSALGVCAFGVYPLTVQVSDPAGGFASSPIPLPYWPARARSCTGSARPKPDPISWIWPFMDNPHQGACPGALLDNSLATSIAPGGRLYRLLAAGRAFTSADHLTWAIDPALLDNVRIMQRQYLIGGSANCALARSYPADLRASAWLRSLALATAGRPVFVTPYADVDIAALTGVGSPDLPLAFSIGNRVASQVLGRSRVPAPVPAPADKFAAVAWPADGRASAAVLQELDALGVRTVLLAMPSAVPYTPSGVTTVPDGLGNRLHVFLPDNAIGQLLGSSAATSRDPGTIFQVGQTFLAETAMIIAERPGVQRPIVLTPPRRWDPATALTTRLLGSTASAPWLVPGDINHLVARPSQLPRSAGPLVRASHGRLSRRLLRNVAGLDRWVALLDSIIDPASPGGAPPLNEAVFGIESSAWQGRLGARHARAMLARADKFVFDQFAGISIKANPKVLLGGSGGSIPVSVRNGLNYPVRVRIEIRTSNHSVRIPDPSRALPPIPAHKIDSFRLAVQASQNGSATVTLLLTSPDGRALPHGAWVTRVEVTSFGTIALLICAAALALFVIGSATRAIRHGRPRAPGELSANVGEDSENARADVPAVLLPAPPSAGRSPSREDE